MSKGKLSVRIPTVKLIKALSDKLKAMEKEFNEKKILKQKYEKMKLDWGKEVFQIAIKNANTDSIEVCPYPNGSLRVTMFFPPKTINVPCEPARTNDDVMRNTNYEHEKDEIEKILRVLKMTNDETVNTSTYQTVSKYL